MPRCVSVGAFGSAPSPHTIGSWSFWLFSIPRRTGLERSSGDWIPASSENSHAASTIPRSGPTSTALTRHRRTRTGSRPIAIRATSYGRDLLLGALTTPGKRTLPVLRIDLGGMFEFALFTELLRGNHKDLLLFRPAFDIKGRDLLVQLVGSSRAHFAQIKGTATRLGKDRIRFHVRRNTFVPADDFICAFEFWDRRRDARFAECWLVPSIELARRTANQRDAGYLTVDAHLDRSRDRWAEFRHPVEDQADVLRRALHELRAVA